MPKIPKDISQEVKNKYRQKNDTFIQVAKSNPADFLEVEIGDSKQTDFYPQVKIKRWDNETNFSLRLIDTEYDKAKVEIVNDKIKWSKGNVDIEFYDFVEGEGGYKMVWYLKEKPLTNKLEFSIQSKGLDFFRQPPLTEEYQSGYSEEFQREIIVTETDVKDLEGNVLVHRPENVVGSYAVYHSAKGGLNDINGKDYKTGKAFHIYRPHIIDAEGKETWGILHIKNGIYSVEIPQEFLDKAVYPIKSNDTFGYTSQGASDASLGNDASGTKYASRSGLLMAPGLDGTITSISGWIKISSTTASVDLSVFLNSLNSGGAGNHGQITSGEVLNTALTTTYGQKDINVTNVAIYSAITYIISFVGNPADVGTNQIIYGSYDNTSIIEAGETWSGASAYTSAKENPWISNTYNANRRNAFYATYTPSATTVRKDLQSKARILTTSSKDLQSKGSLSKASKDLQSKGNISNPTVSKDLQSKGNLFPRQSKDIQSKGAISNTLIKDVQSKANVSNTLTKDLQLKANVSKSSYSDLQSKSNVKVSNVQNLLSKGTLQTTNYEDLQSKGALSNTLLEDLQSHANILGGSFQDLQSKGNLALAQKSYTKDALAILPVDASLQANEYTVQEYIDVATDDDVYVNQTSNGTYYAIHHFRERNVTNTEAITVLAKLKTSIAPLQFNVNLDIWNETGGVWETLATDSTSAAGVEFTLSASKNTNLDDYYIPSGVFYLVHFRITQKGVN